MAAAPKSGAQGVPAVGKVGTLARVVKEHPLMLVLSILGTVATFIVGTARVTGLVLDVGDPPIADTISSGDVTLPPAATYQYGEVTDETGQLSVEVPTAWGNVRGNGWHARSFSRLPSGEAIGPGLNAAPSIEAWGADGEYETPGVFIGASQEILGVYSPDEVLQQVSFEGCRTTERKTYTNPDFTGAIVTWTCPNDAQWRVLAATPTESRAYLVYLQAKLASSADVEAYNRILNTFDVDFEA
jgi:hypothetical protein